MNCIIFDSKASKKLQRTEHRLIQALFFRKLFKLKISKILRKMFRLITLFVVFQLHVIYFIYYLVALFIIIFNPFCQMLFFQGNITITISHIFRLSFKNKY